MKVVLDTNVLISGIFFSGPSYEVLRAWKDGLIQIVLSPEILDEYVSVAKRLSERFPLIEPDPILALISANSEIIQAPKLPSQVCDDPDDDKFLACAVVSDCKVVISGDKHLLRVLGYRDLVVLSPSAFLKQYLGKPK